MPLFEVPVTVMRSIWEWLQTRPTERRTETLVVTVGLFLDIILAVFPSVASVSVRWRWGIWWPCFLVFVFLLQWAVPKLRTSRNVWKVAITIALSIAFVLLTLPLMLSQRYEELANASEGDLIGARQLVSDGQTRIHPMVQVGTSGSIFVMVPSSKEPYFKPSQDAEFRAEYGKEGPPLVSTTIRDADGHVVAVLEDNHWKIFKPFCQDKNFTDDALEIMDSSLHVVFQLRILTDRVQVQGEWWDNQGHGLRILVSPLNPTQGLATGLNQKDKKNDLLIKPMFKYPSTEYLGELR